MNTLLRGMVLIAVGIGMTASLALAATDADIRAAEAALQKAPKDAGRRAELAKRYYLRGSDLSMAGNQAGALADFKAGLAALDSKQGKVPEQHPVFEELRYGLGYTYLMMGQPQDATVVLDQLVAASPAVAKARYLLGIALMSTATEAGYKRGLEIFGQLGKDSPGPDGVSAIHAATRYGYDVSIGTALSGKARDAVATMTYLRNRFGVASGADDAENQALVYGMGSFELLAGNSAGGLSELDGLIAKYPAFKLKNGLTLIQILSNAFYQAGLEQLSKGTPGSMEQAIASFEDAEKVGGANLTDTHHGKAMAYKQLRQLDKMAVEMATIQKIDPDYYKKINTGA